MDHDALRSGMIFEPLEYALTDFYGSFIRVQILDRKSERNCETGTLYLLNERTKGFNFSGWYDANWFIDDPETNDKRGNKMAKLDSTAKKIATLMTQIDDDGHDFFDSVIRDATFLNENWLESSIDEKMNNEGGLIAWLWYNDTDFRKRIIAHTFEIGCQRINERTEREKQFDIE